MPCWYEDLRLNMNLSFITQVKVMKYKGEEKVRTKVKGVTDRVKPSTKLLDLAKKNRKKNKERKKKEEKNKQKERKKIRTEM